MYHFAIFTVLILGLQSDDAGLMSGGGCDPSNDPCFECYSCSEYGRCVPVIGCVASDPQMPEEPAVPEYRMLSIDIHHIQSMTKQQNK